MGRLLAGQETRPPALADRPVRIDKRWAIAWALNIIFLWTLSVVGWIFERRVLLWFGSFWCIWFLVQEAAGATANYVHRHDPETARSFTQIVQVVGGRWFAIGNIICASLAVGYVVGQTWDPLIGAVVGAMIAAWLWGHFRLRSA
jgi:uncharacterized membrane protein YeaQ/YmgE (transglycosylase-associated protein family)